MEETTEVKPEERGLHNWKNLYKKKPTLNDWINLAVIIMLLFAAWAYYHDTKQCKEYIANQEANFKPIIITNNSDLVFQNITASDLNRIININETNASVNEG